MLPKKPRRIVLIDTRFQLRLAGAFLLVQLVLTTLFAAGLYLFMDSELKTGLASAHAAYRSLDRMLLPIVAVLSGFSLLLSTLIITSFVVILSHRIAGPLFRFRALLEELGRRRIASHANLRPCDQLEEVADTLGRALATLAADLSALRSATDGLERAQVAKDADGLRSGIVEMRRILGNWSFPGPESSRKGY